MTNTMTHVEELRKVASLDQCAWDYAQKLMRSSAEEIERLDADAAGVQAELESVRQERHQLRNELTAARLEGERLQDRLKRYEPVSLYNGHDIDWWKTEAERLRGALDYIAGLGPDCDAEARAHAIDTLEGAAHEPNPQVSLGPVKVGADLHQCEECGWMKFTPVGESTPEARHRNLCACQACLQERGREAIDNALKSGGGQ